MKKILTIILIASFFICVSNVYAGDDNTFTGVDAGASITTGHHNTFTGNKAGYSTTIGVYNTASGYSSLYSNTIGGYNTSFGSASLWSNKQGIYNTAIGYQSLFSNKIGNNNTAIGKYAGFKTLGSGNVFIGSEAGYNETGSNKLYIDNSNTTSPLIYGEFDNDYLKINGDLDIIGTLTNTTSLGNRTYTEDNYITDDESLTFSVDALDQQVKDNADDVFTNTTNISTNTNRIETNRLKNVEQDRRLDNHENRIGDLEETEVNLRGEVQFYRGKNVTMGMYGKYDVRHSRCPEVGLTVTVGIGKSYTEKKQEELEKRISNIEKKLGWIGVEPTIIKNEEGYIISISEEDKMKVLKRF